MGFQSLLHSPFLSTYIEYKYLLALSNPIVDKKSGHYSACDKDSLTNFLLLCLKICSSWSYLRLQATIQKKTYIVEMEAVCNKDSLNPVLLWLRSFPISDLHTSQAVQGVQLYSADILAENGKQPKPKQ